MFDNRRTISFELLFYITFVFVFRYTKLGLVILFCVCTLNFGSSKYICIKTIGIHVRWLGVPEFETVRHLTDIGTLLAYSHDHGGTLFGTLELSPLLGDWYMGINHS